MMNCQRVVDLLADLVEGTLGEEPRRALEGHLQRCAPCEGLLQSYRKTSALCRKSLQKEAPAELRARLMAFLSHRCRGKSE